MDMGRMFSSIQEKEAGRPAAQNAVYWMLVTLP